MKKLKILTSILLILSMILTMSACNKETGENGDNSKGDDSASSSTIKTVAEETGYGFIATYDDIPGDYDSVNMICARDERLYFMAYSYDKVTYEGGTVLASCKFDGTDVIEYPLPETQFDSSLNSSNVDSQGNIWYLMYESYYPDSSDEYIDEDYGVAPADEMEEAEAEETAKAEAAGEVVANDVAYEIATTTVAADVVSVSVDENGFYEAYVLYKCDADGNVLFSKNLSEEFKSEEDEYIYFYNFTVDNEGYCYLLQDVNLYVLDPDGNLSFSLSTTNWFDSINVAADGTVIITYYGDNGREMSKIDKEKKEFGESLEFEEFYTYYQVLDAGGSGYDLLLNDNNVLYGYSLATNEKTPILNWLDCDVDGSNAYNLFAIDQENLVTMAYDDTLGEQVLISLTRVPYDQIPVRTVITYAYTNYINYNIRNAILKFNRQNQEYRISTVDYSVYATEDDYNAGVTKLNNDILAGKIPDIIDCSSSSLDVSTLASKGVLLDLYTLIDNDSEFSRDSFVSGALAAQEINGSLYTMASAFNIETTVGLSDIVGDNAGWTFDEMMAAYEKLPEGASIMRYMTKSSFLNYCINTAFDNYVDPETGECHFDSEDFVKLLKIANTFPEEYDYYNEDGEYVDDNQLLAEGKVLIVSSYLYGFEDFKYQLVYLQGKDYTFVGFPNSTRNGHTIYFDNQIALSAKSSNTEGAWSFVKTMLSDDYQTNNVWSFPITTSALEVKKEKAKERPHYTDENGEVVYYEDTMYINGEEMEVPVMTDEDIAKIMDVINNATGQYRYDETVNNIISEEAASFFDGQKTAEDVADLIQNRVQTYIMEQR